MNPIPLRPGEASVNSCSQATNGCPPVTSACWWHGVATVGNCENLECTTEHLAYGLGSGEPALRRIYEAECSTSDSDVLPERDHNKSTSTVYTLNDTSQYNLGCSDVGSQNGKFTILAGDPSGATDDAYYADVDLHQLGAGYKGHIWFTHGVSGSAVAKHKIVGTWAPNLDLSPGSTEYYDILVHIPNHGGQATNAVYNLQRGSRLDWETAAPVQCTINQDGYAGHWLFFGNYELGRGARLWLTNVGVSSSADVGYDAVSFVPAGSGSTPHYCGELEE